MKLLKTMLGPHLPFVAIFALSIGWPSPGHGGSKVAYELKDGRTVSGEILSEMDTGVLMKLSDGKTELIKYGDIVQVFGSPGGAQSSSTAEVSSSSSKEAFAKGLQDKLRTTQASKEPNGMFYVYFVVPNIRDAYECDSGTPTSYYQRDACLSSEWGDKPGIQLETFGRKPHYCPIHCNYISHIKLGLQETLYIHYVAPTPKGFSDGDFVFGAKAKARCSQKFSSPWLVKTLSQVVVDEISAYCGKSIQFR